jgi:hypothetical protein
MIFCCDNFGIGTLVAYVLGATGSKTFKPVALPKTDNLTNVGALK